MSRYLKTKNLPIIAIGICGRCSRKMSIMALRSDANSPGLRVCLRCADERDPWSMPAPATEKLPLQYPRPDVDLLGHEPPYLATSEEPVDG
jgi:hypothetical protein